MVSYKPKAPELSASAAAGSAAALAGASLPVSLAAGALQLVANLHAREHASRALRAASALALTTDLAGMTLDQVRQRVEESPQQALLLSEVLQAVETTVLDGKVRRLAEVLATGLRDVTAVDVSRLHTSVLADLEAPHVALLRLLAGTPDALDEMDVERREQGSPGWQRAHLALRLPTLGAALDVVLAALQRHGLLMELSVGGFGGGDHESARFVLSEMGRDVLSGLEAAAATLQPDC